MRSITWQQHYNPNAPRDHDFAEVDLQRKLAATWNAKSGFWAWVTSTDHKSIGRRYILTAFAHLLFAGLLAMVIRAQLALPDLQILGPDLYNQFFTMHGTAMMFLFAVPMVEGMMIYLIPLMVGARIIAFPRLNAFSYWVYLFGGLFVWIAFFLNSGPDAGWFSYVPLAGPEYGIGKRADIYAQMITFTEVAALAVAVEIIVTILKFRAVGMTIFKMPLFVWASLVTCFMILWSMPSIVTTSTFLILDRLVGTHFFNSAEGGDPLLWQHLFWYFAHPEVYIIFLPSIGLASHVVETFCRRPMFGYPVIVLSLLTQGFLSFGLWVHHMFATGLPRVGNSFFAASSMSIAIPSGTFVFCWLATIATGRIRLKVPMLWIISFFVLFLAGGLSGVLLGSVPINLQMTDTYIIPSHIHYVLMGGAIAPLIGAVWFWFPKITGKVLDDRLGYWQWAFFLMGSLITFTGMFLLGVSGMTRRVYTYSHTMGWDSLNLATSIGSWIIGLSFFLFAINILKSLRKNPSASANPYEANTLEWAATSPPPAYNFALLPMVNSRTPLWSADAGLGYVTGLRVDEKEILVTNALTTEPEMREHVPDHTAWPLVCAVVTSIILVWSIYTPKAIEWGALPFAVVLIGWLYPRKILAPPPPSDGAIQEEAL
jgi:cytochrome c oxidase subunit I